MKNKMFIFVNVLLLMLKVDGDDALFVVALNDYGLNK
jgi:hypothetical protein